MIKKTARLISRLDIKNRDLVKGIHLEGFRVLGDPIEYVQSYYENGVDEIFYQDTVASLYDRNSILPLIQETAKNCFIPLTVGGGIRSIEDISKALKSGADKVSINTAAVNNPDFIKDASRIFGSSTIVVSVELSLFKNEYLIFTDNGREYTGIKVIDWIKRIQDLGAGEIVLTCIDSEGTRKKFNLDVLEKFTKHINVPLVIHGGISSFEEIEMIMKNFNINSFAVASMLHYNLIHSLNLNSSKRDGNMEFLMKRDFKKPQDISIIIKKIKEIFLQNGYSSRKIKS